MNEVVRDSAGVVTVLTPAKTAAGGDIADALEQSIAQCVENSETTLTVNLEHTVRLSGRALEVLLEAQETVTRRGGALVVTGANAVARDTLAAARLQNLLGKDTATTSVGDQPWRSQTRLRLGEMLVLSGLATEDQIDAAIAEQGKSRKRLGQLLIDKGIVDENDVLDVLSRQLDIPCITLRSGIYDPPVLRSLDEATCRRLQVLPLFRLRQSIAVATADPMAMPIMDEIAQRTGLDPMPVLSARESIFKYIAEAYSETVDVSEFVGDFDADLEIVDEGLPDDFNAVDEMAAGSPIVNLANAIIQRAIRDHASDIHIEPGQSRCRVRFRIDGVLHDAMQVNRELQPALVSRLKVMANLDIAERRLPQDGRIQVATGGNVIDLRFSSLPGIAGEKVVLRVLDRNTSIMALDQLGMSDQNLAQFSEALAASHGLILLTGPTGSGKTTTLYSALSHLNTPEKSIVTIEDPVEYQIESINQNQVRDATGLSFARLLRHVLRQDPDIVMVGEIRDRETAEIAIQASLTGHLVLSTLHTNDAIGAITRLLDMGVQPYLLTSALTAAIGQRLVRTVCPDCRTEQLATPEVVERFGWDSDRRIKLARGRGCESCYDSGYKGRVPVHEVLPIDGDLQRLMLQNPGREALSAFLHEHDVKSMFDDGVRRVEQGLTTLEEVLRVARGEH